jgi:hypothetical protein
MKKLNFKILSCLLAGIFLCWHTVTAQLATGKTKFLGNVLGNNIPANFATYWNQVTPENASKWGSVESSRDQMNWTTLDNYYNYAKTRGFKFKFHTLIWGSQYPSWLTSLSAAEQKEEIAIGERTMFSLRLPLPSSLWRHGMPVLIAVLALLCLGGTGTVLSLSASGGSGYNDNITISGHSPR